MAESRLHDELVIKQVALFALERSADLVETSDILIFHLFLHGVVFSLTGLVLEIDVGEVGVVDIHLADCAKKFGSIQGGFSLHTSSITCCANFV